MKEKGLPKRRKRPVTPVEPKGYEPKRIYQKIQSEKLFEILDFDPSYVPWMYIENIIQRVLARVVLQGPYGPIVAKGTKDGSLAVVARGGAFDDYERLEWAYAAAGEEKIFQFAKQVERIDLFTYGDRIDYQLARDLVKPFGDKIELFEDSFYSLDFYTERIKATSISFTPRANGTTTAAAANKLIDSAGDFVTKKVIVGDFVANITDQTFASVTAIDSATQLSISSHIMASGEIYTIEGPRTKLMGWFREGE